MSLFEIQEPDPRYQVSDIQNPVQKEKLVEHFFEFLRRNNVVLIKIPLPQNHATDHVQAESGETFFEAKGSTGKPENGFQDGSGFFFPDVLVGVEAFGAEELHEAHFPGLAPVGAVGGPGDVGVVVGGIFSGGVHGAAGEGDVHGSEDGFGCVGGGGHDDGGGAEAETHEGAVFLGEEVEGAVGEGADEVEVADDGPGFRPGRVVEVVVAAAEVEGEDSDQE